MDKRIWKPLAMTLAVSAASVSYAHADVDIDNDGLIEISTLQQLDLMRYDLAGTSLNGDSTGCPVTGCNGYELVADLDFDTNGNGIADAGDLFWNAGEGWDPVGIDLSNQFTARFNGNGHSISNLWIDTAYKDSAALFGYVASNSIDNLTFISPKVVGSNAGILATDSYQSNINNITIVDGDLKRVSGHAGGLVASAEYTTISDVNVEAVILNIAIRNYFSGIGGVIGYAGNLEVKRASFSGTVNATQTYYAGGIVGFAGEALYIDDSAVMDAEISSHSSSGGLVGAAWQALTIDNAIFVGEVNGGNPHPIGGYADGNANVVITDTYWDSEISGIYTSGSGEPRTTAELKCPTMPGDLTCDPSLYSGWDDTIWDFGTASDYPVLR